MRETAATKVRRRVGLFPSDVIENAKAELLHGKTDGKDDVQRAAHPNSPVRFEHPLAALQPGAIEKMIFIRALRLVPTTFVHLGHFSSVTSDTSIGEEVRWVGKNAIKSALGIFSRDGIEQLQAVALVKPDSVPLMVIGQGGSAFTLGTGSRNRAVIEQLEASGRFR